MASIKFASWNVRQFSDNSARIARVLDLLEQKDPDVFALFEVRGRDVFAGLTAGMPDHMVAITEWTDQANMETLIGVRRDLNPFITFREEFRSKVPTLRPGTLATCRDTPIGHIGFLYVHTKSFDEPRDWGLRDDMFKSAASLKRAISRSFGDDNAHLIVLGDLNTMGMSAAYNPISDLTADQELEFLDRRMAAAGMRRLTKTSHETWWNGKDNWQPSALDHVYAAGHLDFADQNGAEIAAFGWPEKATKAQKKAWIGKFSDHAMLFGELNLG